MTRFGRHVQLDRFDNGRETRVAAMLILQFWPKCPLVERVFEFVKKNRRLGIGSARSPP